MLLGISASVPSLSEFEYGVVVTTEELAIMVCFRIAIDQV